MKKILFAVLLIVGFNAFAQKHHDMKKSPEQRADTISQRMKKALSLTEDQAKKSKEINLKVAQSLKDVHIKYKDMMKEDLKKIEISADSQYKLLLTPDQYSKYLALKEKKLHRHKHGRKRK